MCDETDPVRTHIVTLRAVRPAYATSSAQSDYFGGRVGRAGGRAGWVRRG
jgi:hypothetical protein